MPSLGFTRKNGVMRHSSETYMWKRRCPLRLWRIRENLTRTEAASMIGVATNTYSFYEWGCKFPRTPFVRVWNAGQTTYIRHRWDDIVFKHTGVTYAMMQEWHSKKPKEDYNG